ncbi:MAG: hypothetical protein V1777_00740 [Candidatus Micrarchaeota archaeon]
MTYTRLFSREYSIQYADACMRMAGSKNKNVISNLKDNRLITNSPIKVNANTRTIYLIKTTPQKRKF